MLNRILNLIHEHKEAHPSRSILVGIDGLGGSGKSTLAQRLARLDSSLVVVHIDDFFLPSEGRPNVRESIENPGSNFDLARLAGQVMRPLLSGQEAFYDRYDWNSDRLVDSTHISRNAAVIIEGVYALMPQLVPMYCLKIWVACSFKTRWARGIERDGLTARDRWLKEWLPAEERYVGVYHPDTAADLVVDGESDPNL